MLTLWPQGMLLFQQPVGKNKEDNKRAPGAKHAGRHLALLHRGGKNPSSKSADLPQFQVLLTQR